MNDERKIAIANPYIPDGEYRRGLQTAINLLFPHLSRKEKERLIGSKLFLENPTPDESAYLQSACELTVCAWFAFMAGRTGGKFTYEPVVQPPKDIECSLELGQVTFNIEVKCANYEKQKAIVSGSELVVHSLGRLDNYFETVGKLQAEVADSSARPFVSTAQHMDHKMKDFLLSAQSKFGEQIDSSCLNVLIVCVDDQMDMTKWISYLQGPRGLFTDDSFEPRDSFKNVDAVVFSNLYHRHSSLVDKSNITSHWDFGRAFNFAVTNPTTTKPEELLRGLSQLIPLENAHLREFLNNAAIPDRLGNALGLSYYVSDQVKAGKFKFQGYEPTSPNDE